MLYDDGSISFVTEIMQAVDDFARQMEAESTAPQNELERGLLLSFALGAIRCDLEAVWDALGSAAPLNGLDCRVVFEECVEQAIFQGERQEAIRKVLQQRGWLQSPEV